ncbi:MAG: hypothetical protein J5789_04535 [Oscillospiraceae bacterium]|nr:hypothetical protein [Oscillospiraceae bacterium]
MISSNRRPIFRGFSFLPLLLALLILCSGCQLPVSPDSTGRSAAPPPETEAGKEPEMPRFSEIVYTRPDLDALRAESGNLGEEIRENRLSKKEAIARLEEVYDRFNDYYTGREIARLRYYHDITDSFYADESDWYLENDPTVSQLFDELCRACANCKLAKALDLDFWGGWVVEEYGETDEPTGPTNIDPEFYQLVQQENSLLSEYRRLTADPTVVWQGEERSYLELGWDDSITVSQWEEISTLYYEKYTPLLGELYLRLVGVRQQMAAYLGLDSYEDYAYRFLYGRDYTPAQADALLDQIQVSLAPLYGELDIHKRWDALSYTELNEAENLAALARAARAMGGSIADAYEEMERYELYDIDISEKKGDISFQCYLYSYDCPFAFVKTEGYSDDILSFGHEFGHFTDAWYNYDATDSSDLSEVFSLGMEYLLLSRVPEDNREELTEYKLLDTLDLFVEQGSFAEFEHTVYARPAAEWTVEELNELSRELAKTYGYFRPEEENYYSKSWIDITHFFEHPFYVVSYCVSNDAAFQIYERECAGAGDGLDCWNKMLPRDLAGFLETVETQGGLEDPFAPGRMDKIAALLREKLERGTAYQAQ